MGHVYFVKIDHPTILPNSKSSNILVFVGFWINNEDQSVVVFDFLHGGLGGQWESHNRKLVKLWCLIDRLSWALWVSCELQSLGQFEVNGGSDLLLLMLVGTGFDGSGGGFGFLAGHFYDLSSFL